eukprot:81642-Hanusia_phi.AAC.1
MYTMSWTEQGNAAQRKRERGSADQGKSDQSRAEQSRREGEGRNGEEGEERSQDWFGFVALSSTAATLAYRLTTFAPPNSDILYFFGTVCATFDLLNTLNLPYKITYAIYVLVTLFSGFMAANSPAPGNERGHLSPQVRFIQYFKKKAVGNSNPNKRMSVASKAG